ncbi:tRNA pseudouridine synthase 1 [Coemansia sp. RSA 1813]|nr:tRNA pseudouridine synthase 1 [Coemansia sp. RSA 1843]KAJ2093265.1 tRNA pseudouridine synthase 1 [Coemansia sp. RSA 986]KAJ2573518.1 tRNA pseudouridine synthase 1 [Coemansia sp. RSA 1813]
MTEQGDKSESLPQPQASVEAQPAPAETNKPNDDQNKGTKRNRCQTSKDRREFAHKKFRERNMEKKEGKEVQRQPNPDRTEPRLPKRKVALLMGFCGTGYQGMQTNPNARTIESELFKALVSAGAVSADNATDQSKVHLQRAARTDKGVHAAGQVVALKMIVEDPEIVQKVNACLPDQIRVWGYVRVIRSFNAKTACGSRVYEYLLPTYVLAGQNEAHIEISRTVPFEQRELPQTNKDEIEKMREYRISPDKLQYVRDAFGKYKGTHDFRNFTVTRGCTDTNSGRHIYYFDVSDPMIIDGSEWLSLKVKGQSFMLHQIRKMVGLVILMTRSNAPLKLIDELFSGPRVNVPKAPGLGLLLEQPVFDGYNQRAANIKQGSSSPVHFDDYKEEIEQFKQKFIYDAIRETETADTVFNEWVKSTEIFPEEYSYINADGVIPESAIIIPGQVRRVPPIFMKAHEAASKGEEGAVSSSEDELDTKDD